MAFGGSGGFSFGNNNNNNNTNSGFGGFGSSTNNNTNTGFGTSTNSTGFGGSNAFGSGASTFGSNTGGFGSSTNTSTSLFGNKPATGFGANTGTTSLFGGNSNNNNNNANTTGFGSGGFGTSTNTGGFGTNTTNTNNAFSFGNNANKPAFGASTTTPLFGQGGAGTTGGFGNTGAFGSSGTGTALNQPVGPSDGTASTPFAPTSEKEPNGVTNNYQSITFQQPYQKYSFEELRLADYSAGRQFGNGSGQPGAFGSNAFGGFGSNNTGGFGSNTTANTNPFGAAATSSTGFGSTTATSGFGNNSNLFGNNASKPSGLFGSATTSSGTTGGLFGTSNNNNNTTSSFGGSTLFGGTNTNTGSSLFGNNQNQAQNKPAGGLFGNNAATPGNAFSFGSNNNNATNTAATTGGLFGGTSNTNTGGGLFGSNSQTQNTSGGLFGNSNNNNNNQGNSLFGNKTGTSFGTANPQGQTGGLFGNASNTTAGNSGGLFGNTNNANTNTSGGLFGNNAAAGTGSGLFSGNNNNSQTAQKSLFGGGAFGANNTATGNTGGLFGNNTATNNQTQGGLFGGSTNSGFNFGNNAVNKPANSLFGNITTNQPSGGLFGSTNNSGGLFNTSQNNQPNSQQQQDVVKHASLLDPNPYGQSSIWTGLPAPTPENAKPVFTPLTATQKMKESMMKPPPSLRLNQSRYMTPPRRNGFGFTYSTYGTPNSAASTPGGASLSGSMYGSRGFSGGSFGRSFNKSASVQNLRSQFASDSDDIWKPGAFTSTHRNSSGSIKRLTIDRTIRNDLFSRPSVPALPAADANSNGAPQSSQSTSSTTGESQQDTSNKLKKRVSFEHGTTGGLQNSQLNGETGALVRTETDDDESTENQNGRFNGSEADAQSRGKDLAAVPEDRESDHVQSRPTPDIQAKSDPKPGDYWMRPSRTEMAKAPREKLQRFKDFQVGRYGCGQVTFNGTVDLTALPLDDLFDKIVEIRLRSVTVYPDASSKPPVGKGLNVPSTIQIENSWPRARNQPSSATSGPVFDKHVQRLKKMAGTDFVNYEVATGVWTFRVPHYTRYGLDYDENDDDEMSELTTPLDTVEKSVMEVDLDDYEQADDDEDDTFAFRQKIVPGGFGRQSAIDYEPVSSAPVHTSAQETPGYSEYSEEDMSEDEPSMVGSYPAPAALSFDSPNKPILKARQSGTPSRPLLDLEGDWAEQLQRTISPRKQNRDMLRETQSKVVLDRVYSPIKPKSIQKKDFRTSIDVMNSIFGTHENRSASGGKHGKATEPDFEFPYAKRAKVFDPSLENMIDVDKKWHESFKMQFTGTGDLVYKTKTAAVPSDSQHVEQEMVGDKSEVVVKSSLPIEAYSFDLNSALASSEVTSDDGHPSIQHQVLPFSYLVEHLTKRSATRPTSIFEPDLYELLHILFDDYEDEFTHDLPSRLKEQYQLQIRKDRLTKFLSAYILRKQSDKIARVERENPIAAAILKLTTKDIKGACDALHKAKNYKLMVLVSQLENANETFQDDVRAQIEAWAEQRVLSEMTEDTRALYELCAGNTTISSSKTGNNVPVEDKAKTFSISEEYELDWLQCFALGLWFGRDERKHASPSGVVSIEAAVLEYDKRCARREESQLPDDDPMWTVLKLYASKHGVKDLDMPIFPASLEKLNDNWDASKVFKLHYAITSNVEGVLIDEDSEEELIGVLAYQLGSKGDVAGAAYALMHLQDITKRETMLRSLLDRFAGQLPDPPSQPGTAMPDSRNFDNVKNISSELWTVLTQQLLLPTSWLYQSKALYARAVSNNPVKELTYLVAAKSWVEAHDCFIHRVAPALVVDNDIDALIAAVDLFDDNVMETIPGWDMGGGVYADYSLLCVARGQLNQGAVEGLRKRLVELGRKFNKDGHPVDLGKLPIEELEQRVAVQEMSRVVADKFVGSHKDILELPLTSDQRLIQTVAMAGEYYRGVMAGGETA